ncbi:MAG: CapA family protein [Ruminococcus sp.]|nr:CapA family protein [Ruminococcus sp.]
MENRNPREERDRARRQRNKYSKAAIAIMIIPVVLVALIIFGIVSCSVNNSKKTDTPKTTSATSAKPVKQEESFRMSVAGDYIIYSAIYNDAKKLAGGNGYDFSPMVENLKQFTKNCDVNYYNQETVLAAYDGLEPSTYPMFVSPPEAGDAMVKLGYNLVSTATNHAMDGGEQGILNECKYWKKQKNVLMAGTYNSQKSRDAIKIKECNGITYTMLNYTYDTNGIPTPEGKDYMVNIWPTDLSINDPEADENYQAYKKQVKKDIEAVRDKVDFLIVAIHAGVEYMPDESAYQDDMAQFLSDNDVDLMIGTHPHVIEPARYVGDMMCYYSMGNLLCSQYQDENYNKVTSILSTFTVKKTTYNGKVKIKLDDMNNQLMYCYYEQKARNDFKIIPFSNEQIKEYLPDYKQVYKTYKKVFLKLDKTLPFAPCAE